MLTAVTRAVSPAISECELTFLERSAIDYRRAAAQHRAYEDCLRALGAKVISLPTLPDLPDSVFVEDPALVLDEIAVITRLGALSRRREAEAMAEVLAAFRPLARIEAPGTLEGGDVIVAERRLFVGVSQRTNAEGIAQLAAIVERYGYIVTSVPVIGCLHLKSGACYLGQGSMLANREWVDTTALGGYRIVDVAEEWAADVLAIGGVILMPAGFSQTAARLEAEGFTVRTVDVSELQKAEAGVTCMSLVLKSGFQAGLEACPTTK